MDLELGTGKRIENVSQQELLEALATLDGGDDSFAILSHGEHTFIQTAGGPETGYVIEGDTGPRGQHYQSTADTCRTT